ncbi:L,D-transpeptidase family protein [Cardiobacterium valvarum]|uniref:L,D-TPase catalytic domain-containing protein n=1 Tax=Cardiobacterium valvarum F0432 TaxID=797473 RepID=G9ZJ56_9GAMM|nr:murein L,D-transpeptidase family protein [Cardiobacterium valvarum]EHM50500.1 hypothetical protein HMPREF9080_02825 [Cardiobacterium valvarum F0432]
MNIRTHFLVLITLILAACSSPAPKDSPRDSRLIRRPQQLTLQDRLEAKGFRFGAPTFIRIFKKEEKLEVWLQKDSGEYALFLDYPICIYSGELGPKTREGDKQSPEGFYAVGREAMNPNSNYHLSFNLGYPNAYDRSHGYTGSMLMVHGKCVSIGCYAMGDRQIEEIYSLVGAALQRGQPFVRVHAFPFRLTEANLAAYSDHRWYDFWRMLKPGYDYFETYRQPPEIDVIGGQYALSERNPHRAPLPGSRLPPMRSNPVIPEDNLNTNPLSGTPLRIAGNNPVPSNALLAARSPTPTNPLLANNTPPLISGGGSISTDNLSSSNLTGNSTRPDTGWANSTPGGVIPSTRIPTNTPFPASGLRTVAPPDRLTSPPTIAGSNLSITSFDSSNAVPIPQRRPALASPASNPPATAAHPLPTDWRPEIIPPGDGLPQSYDFEL